MVKKISFILLIIPILLFGRLFKKNTVTYYDRAKYKSEFTEYFLGDRWHIPDTLEKEFTRKALEECKATHDKIKSCMDSDLMSWNADQTRTGKYLYVYFHNGSNFTISGITFRVYIDESTAKYYLDGILGVLPYSDAKLGTRINYNMYNEIKTKGAKGAIKVYWWK